MPPSGAMADGKRETSFRSQFCQGHNLGHQDSGNISHNNRRLAWPTIRSLFLIPKHSASQVTGCTIVHLPGSPLDSKCPPKSRRALPCLRILASVAAASSAGKPVIPEGVSSERMSMQSPRA